MKESFSLSTIVVKFSCILLFIVLLGQYLIFLKDDISLAPIHQQTPASVYLISYADGPEVFLKNQNALAASALNKGFDFILNYRKHHIDPQFLRDNATIFAQKKGAGYWLWKPWIILHTLEKSPENAVIFYVDSGFIFKRPIHDLIHCVQDHDMVLVYYDHNDFEEEARPSKFTKREALVQLNCDTPAFRELKSRLAANFIILKNTHATRIFIKKWLEACTNDAILTDAPSSLPEYPEFKEHRHDQALLGILHYLENPKAALFSFSQLGQYAFWHHRHPETSTSPHKFIHEHSSLLPYTQTNPYVFAVEDLLRNFIGMNWIRKKFLSSPL